MPKLYSESLHRRESFDVPFFSICIPQFNRTTFLLAALRALQEQTFRDFEICISDDKSTDGRQSEIIDYLQTSGLQFAYRWQVKSLRYDANLRESILLTRGRYCLLHGNDDCLANINVLERLSQAIGEANFPAVVIGNYEDWTTGAVTRRITVPGLDTRGCEAAISNYRNVAFVSGVVIETRVAKLHSTDKWDGSEMYQMYLMARALAEGGTLLSVEESLVRKDIQIQGEEVDSYAKRPKLSRWSFVERRLPVTIIGSLVADAIRPKVCPKVFSQYVSRIMTQLYLFTFPFWIVEYRKVQSWAYAFGVFRSMRPSLAMRDAPTNAFHRTKAKLFYFVMGVAALVVPIRLFHYWYPFLYRLAKSGR